MPRPRTQPAAADTATDGVVSVTLLGPETPGAQTRTVGSTAAAPAPEPTYHAVTGGWPPPLPDDPFAGTLRHFRMDGHRPGATREDTFDDTTLYRARCLQCRAVVALRVGAGGRIAWENSEQVGVCPVW